MNSRTIVIEPYNTEWPVQYEALKAQLIPIFGDLLLTMEHIGSTSVPGLCAKPIIDIIVKVSDIRQVDGLITELSKLRFIARGEFGMPLRRFFVQGQPYSTCNLHVYDQVSSEILRHVYFRDYLRSHPKERDQYGQLKLQLAAQHPQDILRYVIGKEAFVFGIDKKSGYHGVRMVRPLTDSELNHYHTLMDEGPVDNHSLVFFKETDLVAALVFDQKNEVKKFAISNIPDKQDVTAKCFELFEYWKKIKSDNK